MQQVNFTNMYGSYYVAQIGSAGWEEMGGWNALHANNKITCLYRDNNGTLACGNFTNTSGKRYVAKFDGTSWSELGGLNGLAASGNIFCMTGNHYDQIYVGGEFKNATGQEYVAQLGWLKLVN